MSLPQCMEEMSGPVMLGSCFSQQLCPAPLALSFGLGGTSPCRALPRSGWWRWSLNPP